MPKYRVLLSVEGSDRFHVEAADLQAAEKLAEKLVRNGAWKSEREDLSYEVCDVTDAAP
jgi:hypothetical protein